MQGAGDKGVRAQKWLPRGAGGGNEPAAAPPCPTPRPSCSLCSHALDDQREDGQNEADGHLQAKRQVLPFIARHKELEARQHSLACQGSSRMMSLSRRAPPPQQSPQAETKHLACRSLRLTDLLT